MSAERLREVARVMRERAEAIPAEGLADWWFGPEASDLMHLREHDREHIASWHPAVALAVADWLDSEADVDDYARSIGGRGLTEKSHAAIVADAYLGATP